MSTAFFCGALFPGLLWGQVTGLQVIHREGQSFVTFTEEADPAVTYQAYRHTAQITSTTGLTPVAILAKGSGINKIRNTNHVILERGTPLADGTGLLVYTAPSDGNFYYAVTASNDATLQVGVNSLSSSVGEVRRDVPGAVWVSSFTNAESKEVRVYYAWEDYASWPHARAYYGHEFNVVLQEPLGANRPLTVALHGDGNPTRFPGNFINSWGRGVWLFPVDTVFLSPNQDPYLGSFHPATGWFGYSQGGIAYNLTQKRVLRYIETIKNDVRYGIDPQRIYLTGYSMGGGGSLRLAYQNPGVFAAVLPKAPWVNGDAWAPSGGWSSPYGAKPGNPVNGSMGEPWWEWQDMSLHAARHGHQNIPPLLITTHRGDNIIDMDDFPSLLQAVEQNKLAHVSYWDSAVSHSQLSFPVGTDGDLLHRFKRNEAFPAFANAVNSDAFTAATGQRNLNLDWSSSLKDLFPSSAADAIVDEAGQFGMTFTATADTRTDVTPRNTQLFRPSAGQSFRWENRSHPSNVLVESGTVQADANGLVTVPNFRVTTTGNRLTLQVPAAAACSGTTVTTVSQLNSRVNGAGQGEVICLADGTYNLTGMLSLDTAGVTLRSASGNRGAVVLDGGFTAQGQGGRVQILIQVTESNITIDSLTLRHAEYHAVQAVGANGHNTDNLVLNNLHIYDCGEQLIKINTRGSTPNYFVDNGVISNSLIEFQDTSIMEPDGTNYYTGGIDAHAARGWVVRDNIFRNIQRNGRSMEHAIHFWRKSRDLLIERNVIINCYRGIGLGLSTSPDPTRQRFYPDGRGDSPYRDALDAVVRNNVVANDAGISMDVGIASWNSLGDQVYNNTVFSGGAPFSALEIRWTQDIRLVNNLLSHTIREREGCAGTTRQTNRENVSAQAGSYFVNVGAYDLHLRTGAPAIDQGTSLAEVADDLDREVRGSAPDIGADEFAGAPPSSTTPARPRRLRVR